MALKVLIADDDENIRMILRKAILKQEGFSLVGEAGDGESAMALFQSLHPEIVFLDVEMPVVNGIVCAQRIFDIDPKTSIIFATAHEEFMSEAFQVYAFDYLVKPFKIERLSQTLTKLKDVRRGIPPDATVPAISVQKAISKLMIRNKGGISLIDLNEIILIQREERSTVIYTDTDRYVTSESLSELESRLDETVFFRSHKSYIINLARVHKISPYGRWTHIVSLRNTEKDALMTHEKYELLQKMF